MTPAERRTIARVQTLSGEWRIRKNMKPANQDRTRACITKARMQHWSSVQIAWWLGLGSKGLLAWEKHLDTERQLNELRRRHP